MVTEKQALAYVIGRDTEEKETQGGHLRILSRHVLRETGAHLCAQGRPLQL